MKAFTSCFLSALVALQVFALTASPVHAAYAYAYATCHAGSVTDEDSNYAEAVSTGALGMAGAVVNLGSGTLRAHALTSYRWQTAQGSTLAFDTFTLWGLPFGTEADIPVRLTVTGTMDAEISVFGEDSFALVMGDLHHSNAAEWGPEKLLFFTLQSDDSDPLAVGIDQVLSRTYTMTAGVPFGISYELQAKTGGIGAADFSSTGALSFDLPAGTGISSTAGFSQVAPEPTSLCLLGIGLLALVRRRRSVAAPAS